MINHQIKNRFTYEELVQGDREQESPFSRCKVSKTMDKAITILLWGY